MSNNSIGSKLALGLNHLTKKVAAQPADAVKEVAKGAGAAGKVAGDALVRSTGAAAKVGNAVGDVVQAAEVRLAKAYDANPKTFALKLAKLTLDEVASKV